MRLSPAVLLSLLFVGCSSDLFTPETNPCLLYEAAINDCAEDALFYLQDTGDVVGYEADLACPAEDALTQAEYIYYDCLHTLWDTATCTTASGMIELSIAAAECEAPGSISPVSSGPQ